MIYPHINAEMLKKEKALWHCWTCEVIWVVFLKFLSGYHIAKGEKDLKDLELLNTVLAGTNIMKAIYHAIMLKGIDSNVYTNSEVIGLDH